MEQRIGRYQILEEIASGGQGTVYRAYDPEGGQIIALKVLHPTLVGDRTYIERFRREGALAASIDHPNVVKIFEVGQDGDRFFMALEFLPENLARIIEGVGQLRIEGAARYGVQIADGLAAAHALGIVHRDVKPQNVLIGPDGTAKVTDFGIARAESLATMTATGAVMGTPHYMSPEQAQGERADARSDVYSLGCMVYQMLAGEVPFEGEPVVVIRQQIDKQPRRLSGFRRDLPQRLESVVEQAMAKDPGKRYQRVAEMAHALQAAVPGRPRPDRAIRREPAPPPVTSPVSGRIAFSSNRDGNWEIYVMNSDGTGQTRLTNNPTNDVYPAWSPDGAKIAFVSFRDGNAEIYVMDADGSGQTNLTSNPAHDSAPAWSPDGARIAFGSNRDGNREIYVMNADGSGQTNLTNNPALDWDPAWSPDGAKIAFISNRDGNQEIYVMNADGSGLSNLSNNRAFDSDPVWSPDGAKIAFWSYRDGNREIYVMNADGSGQTNLTNNPASDWEPAWSPDGAKIAFISYRDGNMGIYVMNSDGTGQTRLTNNDHEDWQPAWSPR